MDLMRPDYPVLEPVDDDGGDLELSLGLPSGGSSRGAPGSGESTAEPRAPSSSPKALPLLQAVDSADRAPDPPGWREAHALRRHEARTKREEKQQQQGKGIRRARDGAAPAAAAGDSELSLAPKQRKQDLDSVPGTKLIPTPNADANANPSFNSNPNLTHPFPVMAMQCPYPMMQCMPIGDGFGVPFMIPCWAPAVSPVAEGPKPATPRNVFQPVACRALRPAAEHANGGSPTRGNSEAQGSSSSPATSDHASGSVSIPNNSDTSSHEIGPELDAAADPSETRSTSSEEPISVAASRGSSRPSQASPPLLRMPCVSATGNGPNGKRITGFLYSYTKAEVSIICTCHGSSFSPAKFVKHAGGTDVAHPLRQITVLSS